MVYCAFARWRPGVVVASSATTELNAGALTRGQKDSRAAGRMRLARGLTLDTKLTCGEQIRYTGKGNVPETGGRERQSASTDTGGSGPTLITGR